MPEVWKKVRGYPYKVSSSGKIKNLSGKPMRTRDCKGYRKVDLYDRNKGYKTVRVHTLVASAFSRKGHRDTVNHKNKDRANNSVRNLEWMTRRQNVHHQHTYKVRTHTRKRKNGASVVRQHARKSKGHAQLRSN